MAATTPAPAPTIGLDIGGTKILGVAADESGRVVGERTAPTGVGPDAVVTTAAAMIGELRNAAGADRELGEVVGAGFAGMVDFDGVVRYAPNLPGFEGVDVRSRLESACGTVVTVDNDANVAALGEVLYGAARGHSEVLLVTLGTGIGGGIVTGGRVYRGGRGLAAEIGHFTVDPAGPRCACGATGHWEAVASGTALGRVGQAWAARGDAPGILARAGGEPAAVTGYHVGASALAAEAEGRAIMSIFARHVAIGLGGLVNILDPEVVIVAGGLVALGDVLLDRVREELPAFVEGHAHRQVPPVVPAELGERAGAIGAAARARSLVGTGGPA